MRQRSCKRHSVWACRRPLWGRLLTAAVCGAVLSGSAVMVTGSWLQDASEPVQNRVGPATVTCQVTERFDGRVKSLVNVTNTGDVPAYIRVKLISYRVNQSHQKIGGAAQIPDFTPGQDWFAKDGIYYYRFPVAPGEQPGHGLIGEEGIGLSGYTDADGGKQVIEVMAEAIQAQGTDEAGTKAVVSAWGIDPETAGKGGGAG